MNQPLHGRNAGRRARKRTGTAWHRIALRAVIGTAALFLGLTTGRHYKTGVEADSLRMVENGSGQEANALPGGAEDVIVIGGIDFSQLSQEEIGQAIEQQYPWSLTITWGEESVLLPNLLTALALSNPPETGQSCVVSLDALAAAASETALQAAAAWERPGRQADLAGFDTETGVFLFDEGEPAVSLDKERLQADLSQAVKNRDFDAVVEAGGLMKEQGTSGESGSIGQQAAQELKERYQIIGTYTTKTTSNSNRNTNILLASQALNGTIVKPGGVLSFNETVGQRTSKKGYKSAAAYSNGAVVQEIGGGVCQVSTTLYNAVVTSGLETVTRKSHTFKPTYVTPGMDATVSWGGPDYEFKNNSEHSVGILAEFANQVLTISIYGVPVLEPGVIFSLESKKTADLGVPSPAYVEDGSLPPGTQVVRKNGSSGSKWATYLVVTKDGQVISRELDHTASYKGHAGVVAVNSQAPVPTAALEQTAGETQPPAPAGPGEETQPQMPAEGPGVAAPPGGPGMETPPVQTQPGGPGSDIPPQPGPG